MLKDYLTSWPALLGLLGAIIVAIAGWVSAIQQGVRTRENADLQRQLREETAQVSALQRKGLNWISGGDSYAYYVPWKASDGRLGFFLQHSGDYPAYDVTLRVRDEVTGKSLGPPAIVAPMLLAGRGLEWIAPESLIFHNPPGRSDREHRITLEISLRSGIVIIQRVRLWPENGAWHTESKDIKQSDGNPPPRPPKDFKEFQEQARAKTS